MVYYYCLFPCIIILVLFRNFEVFKIETDYLGIKEVSYVDFSMKIKKLIDDDIYNIYNYQDGIFRIIEVIMKIYISINFVCNDNRDYLVVYL